MKLAIVIVVLAACAPTFQHAQEDANRHNSGEDARFAARVAAARKRLGAAVFDPPSEVRPEDRGSLSAHPTDPAITLRVEAGRVGYVTSVGNCGESMPLTVPIFATTPTGVTIVLVEPQVTISSRKIKGACGAGGCGIQPAPQENITWLPVADPNAIVVVHDKVPYDRHTVTCEHPSYPP